MLTQLLLFRRRNGWPSAPPMHLGSQRSQRMLLANEFPDHLPADAKTATNRGQADSASFIRGYNMFPKILCERSHPKSLLGSGMMFTQSPGMNKGKLL
jgi:hypothetical protein